MDRAKIEAMRKIVEVIGKTGVNAASYGRGYIDKLNVMVPASTLCAAAEGFRVLVDKAAAEQAEPVAASGDDVLTRFVGVLKSAVRFAGMNCDGVRIATTGYSGEWSAGGLVAVIQAIEAMLDARPTTAASEDGPTLAEHAEALNRGEYLGASDWTVVVTSQDADHTIDADVCGRVAEWLIAREKAAEGGAA